MTPDAQLEPTVFVIFGGAGDLAWRKLIPALFDLFQSQSIPAHFSIIAVDRVELSEDALRERLRDGVNQFSRFGKVDAAQWNGFASHIRYLQGDFKGPATYSALSDHCTKLETGVERQGPSHFLHGHAAFAVWRNPEVPRRGRIGERPGTGANRR